MIRRIDAIAFSAVLVLLTACAGQQAAQSGLSIPAVNGAAMSRAVPPPKNCGGAGGVTVTPCPVKLNKNTKDGVVIAVGGKGVVDSQIGRISGCFNGKTCYNAAREGSSNTQWRITSGASCGTADVEFDGMDSQGKQVGYFFLKIANKYCRHR